VRAQLILLVLIVIGGCSKPPSSELLSAPTAPTTPASLFVSSVALDRRALNGGDSTEATIALNAPATTATVVNVSSDAPAAVNVPASVTVPAGSNNVTFSIATSPVSEDVMSTVTASLNGRTAGNRLAVWTVAANSFWYDSDVGEGIGVGLAAHVTGANASLRAVCDGSNVFIDFNYTGATWIGRFHLPDGVPIRPGTWGWSPGSDFSRPLLQLSGLGRGCTAGGEFTIIAADLDPSGAVRNFVATFKQACSGSSAVLRGEIRLANAPRGIGGGTPPRCIR